MKSAAPRPIRDYCLGIYDGPHATPKEAYDGPVFLGIKNITDDGALDISDVRHVSEEEFPRWTRRVMPQAGDVVFTYEATLHRYAIIPDGFRGCLGRRVALVRPDPDQVDSRYLLYFFLSHGWRQVIESNVITGATVDRIPLEKFPSFPAALPRLRVQQRIADILSAYDDLIENNRRRMALLEEAARQLYREWFVRLRFPGHEHTHISNGLPDGWGRLTIGDYVNNGTVELQTGPFGTQLKASDYTEAGTPVINVRNIGHGKLRAEKLEYVPEDVVERLGVHILKSGDIVFGRKGAVDRHLLIGPAQNGWMQGSDCIRLRTLSDSVSPVFLSFGFREESHKEWMLKQCSSKATMASLNQDVIARVPLLAPDRRVLRQFHDFASYMLNQIGKLQRQSQRAAEARTLLLPRLMSGEIAV
jgi:type I restriction enzyme S subunit